MCDIRIHHYDRAEVELTLLDQPDFKVNAVESQIQTANKRIGKASNFELNQRVLLLPPGIRT
jgi:hypothetical protein